MTINFKTEDENNLFLFLDRINNGTYNLSSADELNMIDNYHNLGMVDLDEHNHLTLTKYGLIIYYLSANEVIYNWFKEDIKNNHISKKFIKSYLFQSNLSEDPFDVLNYKRYRKYYYKENKKIDSKKAIFLYFIFFIYIIIN